MTLADLNKIVESNDLVFVRFQKPLCVPCRMLTAEIDKLINKGYDKKVFMINVSMNECEELVKEFDINLAPSMLLFKNGFQCEKIVGFRTADFIADTFDKYID